jgi:hypothetical protein
VSLYRTLEHHAQKCAQFKDQKMLSSSQSRAFRLQMNLFEERNDHGIFIRFSSADEPIARLGT